MALIQCGCDKVTKAPIYYDTDLLSDEDYYEYCQVQKEIEAYRKAYDGRVIGSLLDKSNKILKRAIY